MSEDKRKDAGDILQGGWFIDSKHTNCHDPASNHAGSIKLDGPRGIFYIFKIEPNGSYALDSTYTGEDADTKQKSRELADRVVKVLNRELPGGKFRVRRKGASK